jgi:biotin carboxyl carrier protein
MATRHRFEVDGEIQTVVVDETDGLTRVTIGDEAPILADTTLSGVPGMISMVIDGQPVRAYVARDGRNFRVTVQGRTFLIAAAGSRKRGRSAVGGSNDHPGKISAPLAGVLIEARVAVGGTIEAGETVLVIEAMKMQNEIQAPLPGTVTAIHFAAGARVEKGEIVLEYEVTKD